MSNVDIAGDGLIGLEYDSRGYLQSQTWPVAVDQNTQPNDSRRDLSPLQTSSHDFENSASSQDPNLMVDWQFQQLPSHHHHHHHHHLQYGQENTTASAAPQFSSSTFAMPIHSSPVDLMSATQGPMSAGLLEGSSYLPVSTPADLMPFTFPDIQAQLMAFPEGIADNLPDMTSYAASQPLLESSSPTDTYLEVRSLTSSSSDNGWSTIEQHPSVNFLFPEQGIFIDPTHTLHNRSLSESSYTTSLGSSWVEISNPIGSPTSDSFFDSPYNANLSMHRRVSSDHISRGSQSPTAVSPVAVVQPIPVPGKKVSSPTRSSGSPSSASPPSRKLSRKSPIAAKTAETKVRKQSQSSKSETTEKKIGKRKGPLKPDQRKQASEIRKLRACLRCKFLKKTVRAVVPQPRRVESKLTEANAV